VGRAFPSFILAPELGPQAATRSGVAVDVHPAFDPYASGPLSDIALLELDEAPHADGVAPAEMLMGTAATGELAVGTSLDLVGYGVEQVDGGGSGARSAGAAAVTEVGPEEVIAGAPGDARACFGDSGGPAYVAGPDGRSRVAGIVSRSADPMIPCAFGSVLTRVDAFSGWIASTLRAIAQRVPPSAATPGCAAAPRRGGSGGGLGMLCALVLFRRRLRASRPSLVTREELAR
jgi:hypothetical protein